MGQLQHRRLPASFLIIACILGIPSLLYGLVTAAEHADQCAAVAKGSKAADKAMKCE